MGKLIKCVSVRFSPWYIDCFIIALSYFPVSNFLKYFFQKKSTVNALFKTVTFKVITDFKGHHLESEIKIYQPNYYHAFSNVIQMRTEKDAHGIKATYIEMVVPRSITYHCHYVHISLLSRRDKSFYYCLWLFELLSH